MVDVGFNPSASADRTTTPRFVAERRLNPSTVVPRRDHPDSQPRPWVETHGDHQSAAADSAANVRPHPARLDGANDGPLNRNHSPESDPIRLVRMVKQIMPATNSTTICFTIQPSWMGSDKNESGRVSHPSFGTTETSSAGASNLGNRSPSGQSGLPPRRARRGANAKLRHFNKRQRGRAFHNSTFIVV